MPYRLIYLGLGLVAVAAIVFGIVFSTEGESAALPDPVESISPQPGDLVPPQSFVEVDMEVGYDADIYVDGWLMDDATYVEGTGVYRWAPGPNNPVGTVWIGWGYRSEDRVRVHATLYHFRGSRDAVRRRSVAAALQGLLES